MVTLVDPGGVDPRFTGVAYRDNDIVSIQEINLPCREESGLVDGGNARSENSANKKMFNRDIRILPVLLAPWALLVLPVLPVLPVLSAFAARRSVPP